MAKQTVKAFDPPTKPDSLKVIPAQRTILVPRRDGSLASLPVPFIQSKHYIDVPDAKPRRVSAVVLHCTENAELGGMARMNANLFHGEQSPRASVTYFVDNLEVVQTVREEDVACGTGNQGPGGIDLVAVQVEIVGRASQSLSQWSDDYSRLALYGAMGVVADVCRRHQILPLFLDADQMERGGREGITTHNQVTLATGKPGGHWDPGPNFPIDAFMNGVQWMLCRLENPMSGDPGYPAASSASTGSEDSSR